LRLVSTTVGPASIAVGQNGPTQLVEAYNAGTGTLALTVASSVSWVTATVGAAAPCTTIFTVATCVPISVALNTSSLKAGMQTGILTVTGASGTVDSPQTITVTVNMGGAVPSSINVYVPPNGSTQVFTPTNSNLRWQATTQDGNNWLSMTISGSGSFKFVYPWYVQIAATPANTPGTYTGTMNLSTSSFAADNQNIAVTMNVTTQPIVQAPAAVNVVLAQGAPPLGPPYTSVPITLTNLGLGNLQVSSAGVTGSQPAGCTTTWLTVTAAPAGASLTIDPTGLPIGTCSQTVGFTTNAANATQVSVPVNLQVVAKGSPQINYQGVVDNATFTPGGSVSPGDIVLVKGSQLSFDGAALGGYTPGPAPPLATTVGGASVTVNGEPAPLFYAFYNQLAFQMPVDTALGTAVVQTARDDGTVSNLASVPVVARAPGILVITKADYTVPSAANPAHAGDALIIWSIGMGPTSPSVATGQPAPSGPFAQLIDTATVGFGVGLSTVPATATPFFAGLAAPYAGLYQINVLVPQNSPTGAINVAVSFADGTLSNSYPIVVQ
jgi:uncharacterized protein (TIGR03437 family)